MGKRKRDGRCLMAGEFEVELRRDGWDKVVHLLRRVGSVELLGSNEIRLDFCEDKDLSVLKFFVDWVISKEVNDMVIWLGSGRRGLFFSGCWVGDIFVDSLGDLCCECGRGRSKIVEVGVVLKYVAVFVIEKKEGQCGE
jgi:hypothetical protein